MVSLTKGQKVSLTKDGLSKLMVGLGWDEVEKKRSFFGFQEQDIDCDAFAFLLRNETVEKYYPEGMIQEHIVGEYQFGPPSLASSKGLFKKIFSFI